MRLSALRQLRTDLELDHEPRITGGSPRLLQDPKRGFRSFGEFAQSVRAIGGGDGTPDERLSIIQAAAPTVVGSEAVGADGGFAVPPDFADEVTLLVFEQSLLPLFDVYRTDSNNGIFPTDTSQPWGSSGVRASWAGETATATQIKPVMNATTMRQHKLLAFVPVSTDMFDDAPLLGDYLTAVVSEAIGWKLSDAFINGNGNGMPLGLLKGNALLTQAKDSGQATATLSATNISGIVSKMLPNSLARCVWFFDSTVVPALLSLGVTDFPIAWSRGDDYVPGTQIPILGRLAGNPIIVTGHMNALGSAGDVALIDPLAYRVLLKRGPANGLRVDLSLDLYWDAFAAAYRFRFRADGQPKYPSAVTTSKGGTASPFVQLAARP
jgi:HK97 family phage major capsid protein